MGLQSTDNRRTYGLVNQTPVIKKTGSRFKVNMLAAISSQGLMNWMVFESNCDSKKFIDFLGRLRRQIKQKIFLTTRECKTVFNPAIVLKIKVVLLPLGLALRFLLVQLYMMYLF